MATERILQLKQYLFDHRHHALRRDVQWHLAEQFAKGHVSSAERCAQALSAVFSAETPAFLPGERIALIRTVKNLPERWTAEEQAQQKREHTWSEKGVPFNFTPDYASVLSIGMDGWIAQVRARLAQAEQSRDDEGAAFLNAGLRSILALQEFALRYAEAARQQGLSDLAAVLEACAHRKPAGFREALQLFRMLHYTLWCEGEYHNGCGRIDLLFWPFLKQDLECGALTKDAAFELLEEFFLTFNRDSDLYVGVQQGDNGQSLMIGGCDRDGREVWNPLSEMILEASCELKLIDPKVNFRVSRETPIERLELGAKLTRAGLGFPQYSNDDVVIPALVKWGYALEDARDYAVAACWEFVIPGVCHEFVNLDAVSIPQVLIDTMRWTKAAAYEEFLTDVAKTFRVHAEAMIARYANISVLPAPFISMLCPIAIAKAQNITQAGKYHNWGIHGTGFAVAADSLTAIRDIVFRKHEQTMAQFVAALDDNYTREPALLSEVRCHEPKLGQNSDEADESLCALTKLWAESWKGLRNAQGGIVRPGTGSAMYYIWHSRDFCASPDGRLKGEPFPANFAPSLDVPVDGPLSVIRSFTKPDLAGVCNGGPLTIEIHASVFTDPHAESKVAQMIAEFVRRGGHQLQLNSIDRDTLIDAQKHPEKHRNLIVRVWGWSGYFVELDKVYQDHVIRRAEMNLNG